MSEETTPDAPKPKKPFRRSTQVRMESGAAERQGRIALHAWQTLGGERAIAFLNSHDEALGMRPLDLAIASPEGYDAVVKAIAERGTTA